MNAKIASTEVVDGEVNNLASVGSRVGAHFIDWFVVATIGALIIYGIRLIDIDSAVSFRSLYYRGWAGLVVGFVYNVSMVTLFGGTVGKLAVHARIVSHPDGGYPNTVRSIRRWLPNIVIGVPYYGGLLGLLVLVLSLVLILLDPFRRSIYDRVGGTAVVDLRRVS
jgi:uncharacterized RDD family membrane protein YckC